MHDISIINARSLEVFPVLRRSTDCPPISSDRLDFISEQFRQLGISQSVYESVVIEIQTVLQSVIVPRFWRAVEKDPYAHVDCSFEVADSQHESAANTSEEAKTGIITVNRYKIMLFQHFLAAIEALHRDYLNLSEMMRRAETLKSSSTSPADTAYQKRLQKMLQTTLLSQLPADFNVVVNIVYDVAYKVNVYTNCDRLMAVDDQMGVELEHEIGFCNGCELEQKFCLCEELLQVFKKVNGLLKDLELLDRYAGETLTSLIKKNIAAHVQDFCQGIFTRSHMPDLQVWLEEIVLKWLIRIYNSGQLEIPESDVSTSATIQDLKVKLTYFMYETYGRVLIDQFFNIIIDFPDSAPVIEDLKECLEMIDLRKHLIKSLKESLRTRILHAGVNTMDILTAYVAAIKAIRYLDGSDVILKAVTKPIKEYLRRRSDTVRKVVTALTEDGPTDLAEELAKGEALKENAYAAGKEDISDWENWQPDSTEPDVSHAQLTESSRSADIISMVVNIYGSKELFVNEYRNLLADRLLSQLDFNAEREVRNIELLKLRFGEPLLHSCEVMLKDISDSKRINAHIQGDPNYSTDKRFTISTLIVSSQFWPAFNKDSIELPKEIEDEFNRYTKSYEAYKGNRTLNWRHITGSVSIEIELADRVLEMSVPPTQAVILYHFQSKNKWTLEELSHLVRMPPSMLRRKMSFWLSHGVIREAGVDLYEVVEESGNKSHMSASAEMAEDEGETPMASTSDQRQEELQVFWSYIVGMLTNLDSLPIERIHQMLKLFASHGPGVEFSREELKNFLQSKVREHKLVFSGGVYQLAK